MNDAANNFKHRAELVLGPQVMKRLDEIKVIVFGVGGVGSWCAESLVRSGVRNLTIVDSDIVCATNINRQAQATSLNIGARKVDEMSAILKAINPEANINSLHRSFEESTADSFNLAEYDYVIDAIDSVKNKVLLIELCLQYKLKFYSSMGAGAKTDPSRIRVARLTDTQNCPLARVVRQSLRKKKLTTDIWCVFSDELPVKPAIQAICGTGNCADSTEFNEQNAEDSAVDWCAHKKRINGALVHITGIFGFTLASLVIRDVMKDCSK